VGSTPTVFALAFLKLLVLELKIIDFHFVKACGQSPELSAPVACDKPRVGSYGKQGFPEVLEI
jgi:hypothetical protein